MKEGIRQEKNRKTKEKKEISGPPSRGSDKNSNSSNNGYSYSGSSSSLDGASWISILLVVGVIVMLVIFHEDYKKKVTKAKPVNSPPRVVARKAPSQPHQPKQQSTPTNNMVCENSICDYVPVIGGRDIAIFIGKRLPLIAPVQVYAEETNGSYGSGSHWAPVDVQGVGYRDGEGILRIRLSRNVSPDIRVCVRWNLLDTSNQPRQPTTSSVPPSINLPKRQEFQSSQYRKSNVSQNQAYNKPAVASYRVQGRYLYLQMSQQLTDQVTIGISAQIPGQSGLSPVQVRGASISGVILLVELTRDYPPGTKFYFN